MPRASIWLGLLLSLSSPPGFAAKSADPKPEQVKAPEQPSASLLEFIGSWEEEERQLIGMEIQTQKKQREQKSKEVRRAP